MNGRGRGRGKVTPRWLERMVELRERGQSYRVIRATVAREGLRVTLSGVYQALARLPRRSAPTSHVNGDGQPSLDGSPAGRVELTELLTELDEAEICDAMLEGSGLAAKVLRALVELVTFQDAQLEQLAAYELGDEEEHS